MIVNEAHLPSEEALCSAPLRQLMGWFAWRIAAADSSFIQTHQVVQKIHLLRKDKYVTPHLQFQCGTGHGRGAQAQLTHAGSALVGLSSHGHTKIHMDSTPLAQIITSKLCVSEITTLFEIRAS